MLQKRRVFNETCLLWCALLWAPWPRHGQGTGQKPERDGRQEGDDPGYEIAQPPGPHPAGICWGDGDSFCFFFFWGGGTLIKGHLELRRWIEIS